MILLDVLFHFSCTSKTTHSTNLICFIISISAGTAAATQAASDPSKTGKKLAKGPSVVKAEAVLNPGAASVLSLGVASENGKFTQLVEVTAVKGVEFSQDRAVQVKRVSPSLFVCVADY